MDIINDVFATIKKDIFQTIQNTDSPYDAARQIAVGHNLDPNTARLLLHAIEDIYEVIKDIKES